MRLLRLELLNLVRQRRLVLALVVVSAVLAVSGIAGLVAGQTSRDIRAAVANRERARWLNQGERDPHSAAHQSIYAFKPVLPLAAIDPGIEPFVGEAVWLEAHQQNDLLNRPLQESAAYARFGQIDPASVFLRFAPLVVFLLAVASVAREREQGLLALTLGIAQSRWQFAAVKTLSIACLANLALVVPPALTGWAGIVAAGSDGDAYLRWSAWVAAAVMYVALLSLAGVAIALRARTQAAAFGQLFIVWIVTILGAPVAASAIAQRVQPLPSFQAIKLRLERDVPAYWTAEVGTDRRTTLLQQFGAQDEAQLDDRNLNLRGIELDYAERLAQSAFDREIGGYYEQLAAQDRVYARLGWLSPAVAFDAASPAIAGTDFAHHRRFIDAAEQYRRALVNRMNADLIGNPARNGIVHTNDRRLWSQVDAFSYPLPGWREAWLSMAPPLAALSGWLLAAILCFGLTTRRLKA